MGVKSKSKMKTKVSSKKTTPEKAAAKKAAPKKAVSKKATKPVAAKKAAQPASKVPAKAAAKAAKTNFDFLPLDDRILVERLGESDRTAGGLYIPDSAMEKPGKGRVLAVGRGRRDAKGRTRPLDVKVGDIVIFTTYAGSEITVDGQDYVVMRETDLLGVSLT